MSKDYTAKMLRKYFEKKSLSYDLLGLSSQYDSQSRAKLNFDLMIREIGKI